MRCEICDFNPDCPSEYYEGLQIEKSRYTRVKKDIRTRRMVCDVCRNSIADTYADTIFRSQEDLGWGEHIERDMFHLDIEPKTYFDNDEVE